ncbi:MAG TPA: SIMPL domain-containing protein [Rhizomicrobium sp.]|nr:SIMPL domain-containing protein [Rhizomicrobium sp.]
MRLSQGFLGIAIVGLALAAPAAPGLAQNALPIPRTITVSGTGQAKAAPDEAHLRAGVVTSARKAADALAANSRAMNQVFAALRRLGIPDKSIQTSDFSVSPQYKTDRNGDSTQEISGYQVSNEVVVTVDDLAKLGPALDALVASGANNLGSMDFSIRDPKPLMAEARAAAMKDAQASAETYADAGGFKLGPILAVSESGAETPSPIMARPMMRMAAAVPVAGGENSVSATVNVTYEIR